MRSLSPGSITATSPSAPEEQIRFFQKFVSLNISLLSLGPHVYHLASTK